MLVQTVETVLSCRWWVIQYTTLSGEKILHSEGSFASKESAATWMKENFRMVKR